MRPNRSCTRCAIATVSALRVTSTRIAKPASPSSAAVSCAASTLMSATATRAPSRAKACAIARPMPLPAPVTTATLSLRRIDRSCIHRLRSAHFSCRGYLVPLYFSYVMFRFFEHRVPMGIRELRSFVAVAERGSLSAAAEVLYLSVPALSAQIANLERELGTVLFDRTRKPARLTGAGQGVLATSTRRAGAVRAVGNTGCRACRPRGNLRARFDPDRIDERHPACAAGATRRPSTPHGARAPRPVAVVRRAATPRRDRCGDHQRAAHRLARRAVGAVHRGAGARDRARATRAAAATRRCCGNCRTSASTATSG